ncbi:cyclic GMP-AMP synthase [Suncus etruscus]|uniref:cyclic GMP-AMP synthase n=1 Tax=Suncus etruscus TaxID=109475 RepID=UPI00210F264E|nr:cyclic GMP-AMP synthase [Suncus etruscus]
MPLSEDEPAFQEAATSKSGSRRGKAPSKAPGARAGAPKVSGQAAARAPKAPGKCRAAPEAFRNGAPAGASGSRRKGRGPGPEDVPERSARAARPRKASARARDEDASGEGPETMPDSPPPPPPEPRARSRRSVREPRPPTGPTGTPGPDAAPGAHGWKARDVLEVLRLRSQEVSAAAAAVNGVVDSVLRGLRGRESPFKGVTLLNAGSYYERVKVSVPNEFDVMFKLEVPRTELEVYENCAAFHFVKFKRNPRGNPLNAFLEDGYLSASKMLSKFREMVQEEIAKIPGVTMDEEKMGSPAVTLLIKKPKEISVDIILALELKSSWPKSTQEGLTISQWLGRKVRIDLRRKPFYLVAKCAKEGDRYQDKTWRLSFSNIEKIILNNHGETKTCCESDGVKCCRKDCLKLMKYLLEQLKRENEGNEKMEQFFSYQVKTAFFHMCAQAPEDQCWQVSNLELCFENFVKYFLQCLNTNKLPHFFIPEYNLFSKNLIDSTSKDFLHSLIENQLNNGFPIFLTKIGKKSRSKVVL